jgi:hypothetical protein
MSKFSDLDRVHLKAIAAHGFWYLQEEHAMREDPSRGWSPEYVARSGEIHRLREGLIRTYGLALVRAELAEIRRAFGITG